eukprot:CAMPEP_0197007908 /NCGR_PEP_ID=MMETSP1380-20130617/42839_1 /TAXON_ID=5936 /ORGANISM="Euplotes crassus, Strain CT5" /LENGTH=50 /DNA_ID=CAMNT_0042428223 /DNA_START=404 /DNA_END=556 /DNA_ORIENTATION=-
MSSLLELYADIQERIHQAYESESDLYQAFYEIGVDYADAAHIVLGMDKYD